MRRSQLTVLLTALFLLGACAGPGTGSPTPTATAPPTATASPTAPSSPPGPTASPSGPLAGIVLAMADVPRAALAAEGLANAATSVNTFGVDLLKREPSGNLVFSPASIVTALAMARAGARGQTATEMDRVLAAAGLDQLMGSMNALDQALAADSRWVTDTNAYPPVQREVTLHSTNAPFAQVGYPLRADYLDRLAADFGAGLRQVDYRADPDAARRLINAWVSQRTAGRIPELLGPPTVRTSTRLILVNAIYLKAPWATPFEEKLTKTGTFTRADGSRVSVPLMHLPSSGLGPMLAAAQGPGWKAVRLGYLGDDLAMTIIVPDDLKTFEKGLDATLLAGLTRANWDPLSEGALLSGRKVDLTLPRFSLDDRMLMAETLQAMGMPTAFDAQRADFTGMVDPAQTGEPGLYIAQVIHQANIDLDEKGTEAAAATAVVMDTGGPGDTSEPLVIRADHPFLFALTDVKSGAVLFMGRVADPSVE